MKRVWMVAVAVVFVSVMASFAEEKAAAEPAKVEPAKVEAAKAGCFACEGCKKTEAAAGKHCGKDMKSCKILSVKDGVGLACSCAADCAKCGEIKDGKCACGKDIVKCNLVGKFVCEKCCMIANKAGKCACGADLVEVKAKEEAKKEEAAK